MPEFVDVADGLQMPFADAMATQRAVRRLRPDPVDDETVLALLRLAVKAPTGSNLQGWEFLVVRDPDVKHQLARLNRQAWSLYRRVAKRKARGNIGQARILAAVQWQADHFEDAPVIIVACLHGRRLAHARGPGLVLRLDLPRGPEPAPRGPSHRARRDAHHPAALVSHPRPAHALAPPQRDPVRGHPARLAPGRRVRPHHPAGPGRSPPRRPLRQSRHLTRTRSTIRPRHRWDRRTVPHEARKREIIDASRRRRAPGGGR